MTDKYRTIKFRTKPDAAPGASVDVDVSGLGATPVEEEPNASAEISEQPAAAPADVAPPTPSSAADTFLAREKQYDADIQMIDDRLDMLKSRAASSLNQLTQLMEHEKAGPPPASEKEVWEATRRTMYENFGKEDYGKNLEIFHEEANEFHNVKIPALIMQLKYEKGSLDSYVSKAANRQAKPGKRTPSEERELKAVLALRERIPKKIARLEKLADVALDITIIPEDLEDWLKNLNLTDQDVDKLFREVIKPSEKFRAFVQKLFKKLKPKPSEKK